MFETINQDSLSNDNKINYSIIKAQLDNNIAHYHFKSHYMPFKSESGFHSNLNFVISNTKLRKEKDIEIYLNKLSALPSYFDQNIYWMRLGLTSGITQPQAVLIGYEQSILAFIPEHINDSEFLKPFTTASNLIDVKVLADKKQQLITILETQVIPAYQSYYQFFTQEYFPKARKTIGVSETPNGNEFYNNRVKHYTTTDMTPDQIHTLGLSEVKRIRKEMAEIIVKTGFKGTFSEFTHFLRNDPQFYRKVYFPMISGMAECYEQQGKFDAQADLYPVVDQGIKVYVTRFKLAKTPGEIFTSEERKAVAKKIWQEEMGEIRKGPYKK